MHSASNPSHCQFSRWFVPQPTIEILLGRRQWNSLPAQRHLTLTRSKCETPITKSACSRRLQIYSTCHTNAEGVVDWAQKMDLTFAMQAVRWTRDIPDIIHTVSPPVFVFFRSLERFFAFFLFATFITCTRQRNRKERSQPASQRFSTTINLCHVYEFRCRAAVQQQRTKICHHLVVGPVACIDRDAP